MKLHDMAATPPTVLLLGGVSQGTASTCLTYLWEIDPATKQRRASFIRLCESPSIHSTALLSLATAYSTRRASVANYYAIHKPDRSVDKALLVPQSDVYLKWVHQAARRLLKDFHGKGIEYLQGNLANEETRQKVFLAPVGKAFDIVFDFTQADASVSGSEEALKEVSALQKRCATRRPQVHTIISGRLQSKPRSLVEKH